MAEMPLKNGALIAHVDAIPGKGGKIPVVSVILPDKTFGHVKFIATANQLRIFGSINRRGERFPSEI